MIATARRFFIEVHFADGIVCEAWLKLSDSMFPPAMQDACLLGLVALCVFLVPWLSRAHNIIID